MNYYELFGITPSPVIEKQSLAQKYFQLQRKFHPDMIHGASEEEMEQSLALTAGINQAFKIFKDDDASIEYYLKHTGILTENEKYELPPDFLMEVMELNELLETGGDAFKNGAMALKESLDSECQSLLEREIASIGDRVILEVLKENHFKKKYLKRLLDRMQD